MDKKLLILGGTAIVSLAVGAVGGYHYAKKKLWDEFSERLETEIEETKKFYGALHKKGEFRTPGEAVRKLIPESLTGDRFDNRSVSNETLTKVLTGLNYLPNEQVDPRPGPPERHLAALTEDPRPPVETNIFEELRVEKDLPEDFDEELARASGKPYIIPVDIFMHNEIGYPQLSLTFFEGDQILVDEEENVVDFADKVVGMANLQFGYLSKDANIVYIRNEKTGYDYEVLRSMGSYAEEIAGFVPEESAVPQSP